VGALQLVERHFDGVHSFPELLCGHEGVTTHSLAALPLPPLLLLLLMLS
jgi:hypothetical protein